MSRLCRLSTFPSTRSTGCPASSVMTESSPRRNMRSRITYTFLTSCFHSVLARGTVWSWDLNLADEGDGGALGHVVGQQRERVRFAVSLDRPPDLVPAGTARGQGRLVAKRAVV